MKHAAALLVVVGAGLLGGDALADSLPVPTVPTVTVPAPPITVPIPTVPNLPAPALPVRPKTSAPAASAPAPASATPALTALSISLWSGGGSQSSGGGSQSSSGRSSSSSAPRSGSSNSPRVKHLHSSRPWIGTTGKKGRRATTLTFVLSRPGQVVFTVRQISPSCGTVGHFIVHGHAGLNRLRFAGRVGRERLAPGTYRITASTAGGRFVQRVTVVVIAGAAPTGSELVALRSANACGAANGTASTTAVKSTGASNTGVLSDAEQASRSSFSRADQPSAAGPLRSGAPDAGGVLASAAEMTAQAIRPALVALLALAIALLALASLPRVAVPEPRFNDVLVRHRLGIAGLGAAALIAVVIVFLV